MVVTWGEDETTRAINKRRVKSFSSPLRSSQRREVEGWEEQETSALPPWEMVD